MVVAYITSEISISNLLNEIVYLLFATMLSIFFVAV